MKTKKLYRTIARRYNVRISEVRHEMQAAINKAYINPNATALAVPRKGEIPTVEEFIDYNVKMINKDMLNKDS